MRHALKYNVLGKAGKQTRVRNERQAQKNKAARDDKRWKRVLAKMDAE
eukprot:CAMPEP_0174831426 /NCGR_PEP_ID=MMETSP1114-20130205/3079_1 /TAXON_ID=312471 /ORGANISM="Neobodo designis, Strain CCAP 1951/1" /LENGTH=47 /DNA_ID= /DNA_START= /DNA_END= /DNA_ORIENTATION=